MRISVSDIKGYDHQCIRRTFKQGGATSNQWSWTSTARAACESLGVIDIGYMIHRRRFADLRAVSDVFFFLQNCVAQTEVFHASKGGAEQMAKDMQVPFLGRVPLDPLLSRAAEEGRSAFGSSSSKGAEGDRSAFGSSNLKGNSRPFMPSLPALQAIIQQLMQLTEGGQNGQHEANGVQNGGLH